MFNYLLFFICTTEYNSDALFVLFSYQSFLKILEDGQPTYLPPIKPTRTGTFTLDDKDTITLPPDLGDRKDNGQIEKKDQLTLRQGMKSPESRSQNGMDHFDDMELL